VNFLVDHQLPPALARFLESQGHSAKHVRELGLKQAPDMAIWRYAVANDIAVISKDEDFYFIATSPGANGRLVWVRVGNWRKQAHLDTFRVRLPKSSRLLIQVRELLKFAEFSELVRSLSSVRQESRQLRPRVAVCPRHAR
jgi:predicted nuclease of predicted toxin-antitoxin system